MQESEDFCTDGERHVFLTSIENGIAYMFESKTGEREQMPMEEFAKRFNLACHCCGEVLGENKVYSLCKRCNDWLKKECRK